MHDINQALAMKLWWQLRTSNSLWASFMRNKYAQKFHITDYKIKVGISGTWCRMLKVKEQTEKYTKWIIGKGETDFWKERWWGDGRIADLIDSPNCDKLTVRETIHCRGVCAENFFFFWIENRHFY